VVKTTKLGWWQTLSAGVKAAIIIPIAAVGICYYLASRQEVAQVLHEVEEEADEPRIDQAAAAENV
jgi:hypothetical protein